MDLLEKYLENYSDWAEFKWIYLWLEMYQQLLCKWKSKKCSDEDRREQLIRLDTVADSTSLISDRY